MTGVAMRRLLSALVGAVIGLSAFAIAVARSSVNFARRSSKSAGSGGPAVTSLEPDLASTKPW